jgi:hypothetical protein
LGKILVAFGTNAGIVGLFLPVARVIDKLGPNARETDLRIWGGFDSTEPLHVYGWILLAFFVALSLCEIWILIFPFTRARALTTLVFAISAEVAAAYLLLVHLKSLPGEASIGPGLALMVAGAAATIIGCVWALIRPEPKVRREKVNV